MCQTKFFLLVITLSLIVSGFSGYMAAATVQNDIEEMSVVVQTELKTLSKQISASRHSVAYIDSSNQELEIQSDTYANRMLLDELSAIIRESLQTERELILTNMQHNINTAAIPSKDPEMVRASLDTANTTISSAISLGVWDENSMKTFREALLGLSGSEWDEANSRLYTAINNGELRVDDPMNLLMHY